MATGDAYLLEHNNSSGTPENPKDKYWSDNHDGSGQNMLGLMLTIIRNNQINSDQWDLKEIIKNRDTGEGKKIIEMLAKFANDAILNKTLNYTIY